jgi:hypothetical protein
VLQTLIAKKQCSESRALVITDQVCISFTNVIGSNNWRDDLNVHGELELVPHSDAGAALLQGSDQVYCRNQDICIKCGLSIVTCLREGLTGYEIR